MIYKEIRNVFFTLVILTISRKNTIDIVYISHQYFYQYAEITKIKT